MKYEVSVLKYFKLNFFKILLKVVGLPLSAYIIMFIISLFKSFMPDFLRNLLAILFGVLLMGFIAVSIYSFIVNIFVIPSRLKLYCTLFISNNNFYYQKMVNSVNEGDEDGILPQNKKYLIYKASVINSVYFSKKSILVFGDIWVANDKTKESNRVKYVKIQNIYKLPNNIQFVSESDINSLIPKYS